MMNMWVYKCVFSIKFRHQGFGEYTRNISLKINSGIVYIAWKLFLESYKEITYFPVPFEI